MAGHVGKLVEPTGPGDNYYVPSRDQRLVDSLVHVQEPHGYDIATKIYLR